MTRDFPLRPLEIVALRASSAFGAVERAVFPVLWGPGKHGDDDGSGYRERGGERRSTLYGRLTAFFWQGRT
jgi:hypothetical protein